MDDHAERILKRYSELKSDRTNWDTYWEYLSQFVLPNRSDFIGKRIKGDITRSNQIYDSTAVRSARLLARSIQGAILTGKFCNLRVRNNHENADHDGLNNWLEQCADIMLAALEESNFHNQAGQAILNMVVFGTMGLSVEGKSEDLAFDGLIFRDESLSDFVFDEDAHGAPEMVYRSIILTAHAAYMRYGNDERIPEDVRQDIERRKEKGGSAKIEFIESIEPISLFPEKNHYESITVDGESRTRAKGQYYSCIVYKPLKKVISEQYFQERPMLVARWDKITGDQWGWSEAMTALPDIITLNEIKRLELGAVEKAILPPKEIAVGVLASSVLNRAPNGITMVNKLGQIQNIDEPYDFRLSASKTEELQYSIKSCFHEQELILPDRANDTATEVRIRYELMQRLLGPTFGRLKSEFLNPLINRVWRIMLESEAFPPMPQIDGLEETEIDVEYLSPLARSQRQDEVQAVSQVVGIQQSLAEQYPETRLAVDPYEVMKTVSDASGAPAKVLVDKATFEEKVAQAKQQAAEQLKQQQQHEIALRGQNAA